MEQNEKEQINLQYFCFRFVRFVNHCFCFPSLPVAAQWNYFKQMAAVRSSLRALTTTLGLSAVGRPLTNVAIRMIPSTTSISTRTRRCMSDASYQRPNLAELTTDQLIKAEARKVVLLSESINNHSHILTFSHSLLIAIG
jgi:hypothetical protein